MAQRITGKIPQPGFETQTHQPVPPPTKREGLIASLARKVREARKRRDAAAARKATAKAAGKAAAEKTRRDKEVSLKKTESAIEKRRRRQREELRDLGI